MVAVPSQVVSAARARPAAGSLDLGYQLLGRARVAGPAAPGAAARAAPLPVGRAAGMTRGRWLVVAALALAGVAVIAGASAGWTQPSSISTRGP